MQAQQSRTATQVVTSVQSLAAVQTLLKAGLGCITFLRNLLPEDNFTESHFTTSDESFPDASFSSHENSIRGQVNGFKVMTMTRGHTDEADRILNYLEYGIFDALQKRYLRSFIFAVYLDGKEPNNIVEAYTFNFQYHVDPVTKTAIPILSLGDGLQNMSLTEGIGSRQDPVAEATRNGRAPTLKEVKRSVKTLLKTLIHATTQMDELPKRRYATFKVFYTEETPSDYEPPHFQEGDVEKDKWFFMTHDLDEVPDRWNIGKLETGHHSVNLAVTSIATYLPSSTDNENATFTGTTHRPAVLPSLTPIEQARARLKEAEVQKKDAECRNLVWSAEDNVELGDEDAEGDIDPEYTRDGNAGIQSIGTNLTIKPIGMRNLDGFVESIVSGTGGEVQFSGAAEDRPTRLGELFDKVKQIPGNGDIEQTQLLSSHEEVQGISTHTSLDLESVTLLRTAFNNLSSREPESQGDLSTETFEKMTNDVPAKFVDKDPETQFDSIESVQSNDTVPESIESDEIMTSQHAESKVESADTKDKGLDCECGVTVEDELCFCDGGCGRWYHVWCMGYHSTRDKRMPSSFICFDCRVRADLSWELIKGELFAKFLAKFKDLAVFRRAIKIAETTKFETAVGFAKHFDCDNNLARRLIQRLEAEDFIFEKSSTTNDIGFTEVKTRMKGKTQTKGRKAKLRKNAGKTCYVFNKSSKSTAAYSDYFNPDQSVENRMLGLAEIKSGNKIGRTSHAGTLAPTSDIQIRPSIISPQQQTQTQDETQAAGTYTNVLKRAAVMHNIVLQPRKKVKISVTTGVDLAE